jgi:hypothetical protein
MNKIKMFQTWCILPPEAVWLLDPSKHHFVGQPEAQSKEVGRETAK